MHSEPDSYSVLQNDATSGLHFGIVFQFCSSLVDDVLTNPFHIAYTQSALDAVFAIIYGFSPATAGKSVATEVALYFNCTKELSNTLGDAVYVAINLAQDTTPFGMLRSTATLMGKTLGYKLGFWAEQKLFSMSDTVGLQLSKLSLKKIAFGRSTTN